MPPPRVLFICHNHPSIYPGGSEQYAFELYQAMRAREDLEPFLLARIGPTVAWPAYSHPGTRFSALTPDDPNQYLVYADAADFDPFQLTLGDKSLLTRDLPEFLRAIQPDVVHLQHTHYLGYDVIRAVRNTLPQAKIVYTLHEYWPICHRDGQMLRVQTDTPCIEESPRRCNQCFPQISAGAFFMRKLFIQSHLAEVDLFLAPSEFLMERYVAWGIPRGRIRFNDNGREPVRPYADAERGRPRNRIGYFGQFAPHKGVTVLLEAMKQLERHDPVRTAGDEASPLEDVTLTLHGANLEWRSTDYQALFKSLLDASSERVFLSGEYALPDLPLLMRDVDWVVVPSIWWENSPLTIQEAFQYGRPVICSGIGGMAEKVRDGVDGLHFRAGDPASLAETIARAVTTDGLWEGLRAGIRAAKTIDDDATGLLEIYQELKSSRTEVAA
jgi:glycosyltransferase involved in cell wall biosynthesis